MCQTCNVVSHFGHDSCASLVQPVQQVYHTKAMSTIAAAQNMALEAPSCVRQEFSTRTALAPCAAKASRRKLSYRHPRATF